MSTVAVHHTTQLTGIAPQFLVDDLKRANEYYCDKLGFELAFEYQSFYASVTRDVDAFISVSGIRGLFSELEMRGAQVMKPLEARPWACLDFYVEDPDGYILCFSEQNA